MSQRKKKKKKKTKGETFPRKRFAVKHKNNAKKEKTRRETRRRSRLARTSLAVNMQAISTGEEERLWQRTAIQTLAKVMLYIEADADCEFS